MNGLLLALVLPLAAAIISLLARRLPWLGSVLAVACGVACLILGSQAPLNQVLDLPGSLAVEWTPVMRLVVLGLWGALVFFGLLELAQSGRSYVIPATQAATGLAAIALVIRPFSLAVLALQIGGLLLVFPALQGPARRPWGSLGYLALTVWGGAIGMVALWLADFYTQNPDESTARTAATLLAVMIGLMLALVPLHLWLPRLAEASPYQVTICVGLIEQLAVVGLLMRIITEYDWLLTVAPLIQALILGGLLSLAVGGLLALTSATPRHWLAYAMIYNLGLVAIGVGLFSRQGAEGASLALVGRSLALALAAAGFRATPGLAITWDEFRGLRFVRPAAALALTLGGMAFAGIPPFAGFPGMWLVYRAAYAAAPPLAYLMLPGAILMGLSIVRLVALLFETDVVSRLTAPRLSYALTIFIAVLIGTAFVLGWFPSLALTPITNALATLRFLP